ncbi:zinc ribbon domain-containing protein [Streptomyces spectabilis]|uniref:zinc ribbon domain-containing protein n=1 Tax=Streptomyces spectabilis TaxID=68270 RepID=UPI0033F47890
MPPRPVQALTVELGMAEREFMPEEAMVTCPECQAALSDDDRFCTDCGYDVGAYAASGPLPRPVPPTTTTRNSLSGDASGPVIQAGTIEGGVTVHTAVAPGRGEADGWHPVGRLRRGWFGVRPTSRFGDEESLPPYVFRDCDGALASLVARGLRDGGLVVVTGGPLSGKTMTAAWAALHADPGPGTRVHAPHPGADLRAIPSRLPDPGGHHILWLDDLEGHLGPHGLTAALLARFTQERVLVLATMSDTAYDEHRFGGGPAARVLSGAHTVELSRRWSEAELERLAGTDDPGLADARTWRGKRGVTEYLALAPELWDEWRRARRPQAHPRGHLLVRAAVDLARCGLRQDVPLALLRAVHELYPEYGADHPCAASAAETESFEDALAWATRARYGATGLLVPGAEKDTYRAYGSLVADAVRSGALGEVSDEAWVKASSAVARHGLDAAPMAEACRTVLTRRVVARDVAAYVVIGLVTELAGDVSEAEVWYRRAADRGNAEACDRLGHILASRGAAMEAIGYLEKAAEAGREGVYAVLGKLHRERARHWLTRGAESGDPEAAFHLAELVLRPGGVERAARWYRAAAGTGHPDARFALNTLRIGINLPPEREAGQGG